MAKNDTKNVPLMKEADHEVPRYVPSDTEKNVVKAVFHKFRQSATHRDMAWENFDGLTLVDYINESVRRTITNVDMRDGIEDWQARVNDKFTQNKVNAIHAKVMQVLPIAEFQGRGDEDYRKGQIMNDLYQFSEDVDDYEKFMTGMILEAIMKGTAIGYEGHERSTKKIRNVTGSGDNLKVVEGSKKTNRLYGTLVPLEDFFPSHVGVTDIKSMPYCFWRTIIPYQQFLQDYAAFSQSTKVLAKNPFNGETDQKPYYLDYISDDVEQGSVEIIRYYNRDTDEYVMVANGVWLNPITGEIISPLPFNHKELPFWDVRFELINNFFYGRSLPDKLKAMQDVLNVLTNMLLDQSFLTIFPPILTSGFDSVEDDYLRPGRRTPIDTQGIPLKDQYLKMDMGVPQGWHQFILQYTRKVMEESSVDQVSQGVAGVGGRTTAQEIRVAAEGVASILGLFGRQIKHGLKRKALLRARNILQFWTDKNSPFIEQVLGEGGTKEMNQAFNIFKIDNTVLTGGKRGVKIIEMYKTKKDRPTKSQLQIREALARTETNKNVEVVAVLPEYIRDFEFDVKLAVNSKSEDTKEMERALQLEKLRVYMSFFPNEVDHIELLAQTAEKMGDDPTKIIAPQVLEQAMMTDEQKKQQEAAAAGAKDNGMSTLPQGTPANQGMEKAMGKDNMVRNMQMLQNQMIG
jgi:hypothetical protein